MGKEKRRMPLPEEKDLGSAVKDRESTWNNPLKIYLEHSNLTANAFSRAIGVQHETVTGWITGKYMPALPAAYEIERVTKGVVPMEAWLAHPKAKSLIASWRNWQPKNVQREAMHNKLGLEEPQDAESQNRLRRRAAAKRKRASDDAGEGSTVDDVSEGAPSSSSDDVG